MTESCGVPLPRAGEAFLRIEPGMHTAAIGCIGVDAAGTLMVTGSDDKTARLWALPEGGRGEARLLRTLRVPIGEGNDGKIYAVALSPEGKFAAAGRWSDTAEVDICLRYNACVAFSEREESHAEAVPCGEGEIIIGPCCVDC